METTGNAVTTFQEKPIGDGGWVNGGFFVLEPTVLDLIDGDATVWEKGPLAQLTADDELTAYHHRGFWHPMDTMRDKTELDRLWRSGDAPWRVWR